MDELPLDKWFSVIDTNVTGVFCARGRPSASCGAVAAGRPHHQQRLRLGPHAASPPAPYTASKHAVTGLTKALALDGRAFDIVASQIDIGNALTELSERMTRGVLQANGTMMQGGAHECRRRRPRRGLYRQPAARHQRAVHDGDGEWHAVRRPRLMFAPLEHWHEFYVLLGTGCCGAGGAAVRRGIARRRLSVVRDGGGVANLHDAGDRAFQQRAVRLRGRTYSVAPRDDVRPQPRFGIGDRHRPRGTPGR